MPPPDAGCRARRPGGGGSGASGALRDPIVLGADFHLRDPRWPGFTGVGGHDVDHLFIAGALEARGGTKIVDRGTLSDHAPVAVDLWLTAGQATV